jgi:hypothetical protein
MISVADKSAQMIVRASRLRPKKNIAGSRGEK